MTVKAILAWLALNVGGVVFLYLVSVISRYRNRMKIHRHKCVDPDHVGRNVFVCRILKCDIPAEFICSRCEYRKLFDIDSRAEGGDVGED